MIRDHWADDDHENDKEDTMHNHEEAQTRNENNTKKRTNNMSNHHISNDGQTIVCTAPANADCRTRSLCDSETWNEDGCTEHVGEHAWVPGQECWQAINLNAHHLTESYANTHNDEEPNLTPGAAVEVEWEGECSTWHYIATGTGRAQT